MKNYNNFRRTLLRTAASVLAAAALMAGCTKVDDTLGGNLIPENQQMRMGFTTLPKAGVNPKKYVETRLFQTDSILASNLSTGYLGSQLNDTLGLRTAGFLTQYLNYYYVPDKYFGYKPIFDSAQLLLSISSYGADTLTEQTFAIYEIASNDYLTKKPIAPGATERDTLFYLNFDPDAAGIYDRSKKLFTFTLGGDHGPSTTAVTLDPTDEGYAFIRRLMLQEGKYKDDYTIYGADSLDYWVEEFKGLYICPDPDAPLTTSGTGAIYSTDLSGSGLSVYGRNRSENDPSLIKDTVGMVYYFNLSDAEAGNVSVNVIDRDYTKCSPALAEHLRIDAADAAESNEARPENPTIRVEGMGGAVTELTFSKLFFDALEEELATAQELGFRTLAFSQVRMSIYFPGSDYDWRKIDPTSSGNLIAGMTAAPSRLGLYTNYKKLTAISDYNYIYENSYSLELAYGGYINRSRGCYTMDVTGYVQQLWNSYTEAKRTLRDHDRAEKLTDDEWQKIVDKIENRSVYLGPEAYSLFTPSFGVLQGAATDESDAVQNNAPIRFDVAYNMIK